MEQHHQLLDRDRGRWISAQLHHGRIEEATEPRRNDRAGSFWPCTRTQQQVIDARFKSGLHFVGGTPSRVTPTLPVWISLQWRSAFSAQTRTEGFGDGYPAPRLRQDCGLACTTRMAIAV